MCARLLGTCLVALTLAAGCSSQAEEPSVLPRVTVSPSPTPSAAVVVVPTAAQAATPQGAAAFARFFYEQVALGFQTQDPELVSRLSLPSCEACNRYVESITAVRDDGLRVEGGDFEILFAVSPGDADSSRARVDVGWNFSPVRYYDSSGTLVDTGPAVKGVEETMQLARKRGVWVVETLVKVRQRS